MESKGGAICTDSIIIYKDLGRPNHSSRYSTDGCWPLKASVQQRTGGCWDREVRGAGVGKMGIIRGLVVGEGNYSKHRNGMRAG